jgi:hypothetical protein
MAVDAVILAVTAVKTVFPVVPFTLGNNTFSLEKLDKKKDEFTEDEERVILFTSTEPAGSERRWRATMASLSVRATERTPVLKTARVVKIVRSCSR